MALLPLTAGTAVGATQSYATDTATLHLWHFDGVTTPVVDFAPGGTNLTYLINGATLGNASYSSGTTSFTNCASFGNLTTAGAVLFPIGSGDVGTAIPFAYAGANGAFTFEAIVHIEFDPSRFVRNQPCQIMNCDADSTGTRVFQLRVDPVGFTGGGGDTNFVRIEFINGTTTTAMVPLPTTGPDAIVSNSWYHVAVTYNGSANTASNLLFYWTQINTNKTVANCIYGTNMASSLPGTSAATTIFSIGNSARNPSGGAGAAVANFLGKIDEVRISNVARAATDMLFGSTVVNIVSQPAPASQVVGIGQSFNLSVAASGKSPIYQWRLNGLPVFNATNSIFTNDSAQTPDSGNYDVVITNTLNSVTSSVALVVVTNLTISSQPASIVAPYAGTAIFNVGAVGAQPIAYQWRYNGSPIPGATNSTLTLTPLDASYVGSYDVVVANNLGSVTSSAATLEVGGPVLTFTPVTDGTNAAASGYAYAGSSDINGVAFICSGLKTVGNQQFLTYYGRHQTDSSYAYNNTLWIARRTVGAKIWQVFRTSFTPNDITDGHDVVAFGIDGAGYMHLSWGMHDANLHYARSVAPVTGSQPIVIGPDLGNAGMTGTETSVTYPQFLTMPNGDLLFLYRIGASGGGNTCLNRWSVADQAWTNVNLEAGTAVPFIQGLWPSTNYNAYPNMPCLDANGDLYFVWTWRETPAYESNHDLNFAKSLDGGVTWQRFDGTPYDLPISRGENGDPNTVAQIIVPIPQNSSLINQAGMCLDASNNPVVATWWAPGSSTNNFRRQYIIAFPDANGVWQTRQISNRTNDPTGAMELDSVVRDLGRPVVVCDKQDRIIVLYRDNFGSNGLTLAYSLPYSADPSRTNWTTIDLTTDNLGNYEPVIDLSRWQQDNVLDILYQPSTGEGYSPPANNASPIGVVEWDSAAYFNHHPVLQFALANANQNAVLSWNSQLGWGYQVQWSTDLVNWNTAATLNGIGGLLPMQFVHTNGVTGPQRFWRLQAKEGGF